MARPGAGPAPRCGTGPHGPPAAAQTIRVGVALLETMMTLVGELGLTRNQLVRLPPQADHRCDAALQRLSQLTTDLQGRRE